MLSFLHSPRWHTQAVWRRAIWSGLSRLGLTGLHALPLHRNWTDVVQVPMPFPRLAEQLHDARIVQISDLHYSPVVSAKYLRHQIDHINDLAPDLVFVTGDLVTGGYRYVDRIAAILAHLKAPLGVVCTLGNHDYSMYGRAVSIEGARRADRLAKSLTDHGMIVLRNRSMQVLSPAGVPVLNIVGLDDEWTGRLDAPRGFAGLDSATPTICLNHNPRNAVELLEYPWHWMLAGHTHGRQLGISTFGRRLNRYRRRKFVGGYYSVHGRHLYVNRGLSYGQRTVHSCRPEITLFQLRPE